MQQAHEMTPMDAVAGLANIALLTLATIGPVLVPGAGLVFTYALPVFVVLSARKRSSLGPRWYALAALPIVLWTFFLLAQPVFGLGG